MDFSTVYAALLAVSCTYALLRGGGPERVMAGVAVVASLLTLAVASALPVRFHNVEAGIATVDVFVLAALCAVAVRAERYWPIWAAGFHLADMFAHLAREASSAISPRAYAIFEVAGGYLILITIIVGTRRHRMRLARHGADPSWSSS